jgi:hypothetical protein
MGGGRLLSLSAGRTLSDCVSIRKPAGFSGGRNPYLRRRRGPVSASVTDGANILSPDPGASHRALAATEETGDFPESRIRGKKPNQQRNGKVALVFAVGAPAVRDESVVFLIEPDGVLNPTDSNIASHLSLPHCESVGSRNVLRPTRSVRATVLYEWKLALIVRDLGLGKLDQCRIIIFRTLEARRISNLPITRALRSPVPHCAPARSGSHRRPSSAQSSDRGGPLRSLQLTSA